jgi:Ca2+-transporting ATPase
MSVAAIAFATELRPFQRILDTVELTGNQWLICIGGGLVIIVVSEIRKLLLRRREAPSVEAGGASVAITPEVIA